jgi:hypothetical protein
MPGFTSKQQTVLLERHFASRFARGCTKSTSLTYVNPDRTGSLTLSLKRRR